jgi:hypothetical protein
MISVAHSWQLSVRPPAGVLLENRSLDFSRYFTHLKSQEPATDKVLASHSHPCRCDQSWSD